MPAGVLGDNVTVSKDKTKVTVTSEIHMSKRWGCRLMSRAYVVVTARQGACLSVSMVLLQS